MHLGGPGRGNSVFWGPGQCSTDFSLSDGLRACFWKIFGTTFGRRELIFWFLKKAIVSVFECASVRPYGARLCGCVYVCVFVRACVCICV